MYVMRPAQPAEQRQSKDKASGTAIMARETFGPPPSDLESDALPLCQRADAWEDDSSVGIVRHIGQRPCCLGGSALVHACGLVSILRGFSRGLDEKSHEAARRGIV